MFLNSTYGIVLRDKKQKHGVFYHEFGHFVDWLCSSISETHEWHELFWEYRDDCYEFMGAYGTHKPIEFFAECFSYYYIYPKTFKSKCPDMYYYMDALMDEIPYIETKEERFNLWMKTHVTDMDPSASYCAWTLTGYDGNPCEYCAEHQDLQTELRVMGTGDT